MDAVRRFGSATRLYGAIGAARIQASHVMVIGLGGVGSWAVEALVRSGVGRITLVDLDHVSESNINRQVHATESTLGQSKVRAMTDRVLSINPDCNVFEIEDFVTKENWTGLLPTGLSAVIDACDQVSAKVTIADWARLNGTTFISAGAAGGKRHAHLVDINDLVDVTHDPLLAQVRNRLRREHAAPRNPKKFGIACVYSAEAVKPPDGSCVLENDGTLNCHGYGSVVSVTATFGHCAAGWILDKIAADF